MQTRATTVHLRIGAVLFSPAEGALLKGAEGVSKA